MRAGSRIIGVEGVAAVFELLVHSDFGRLIRKNRHVLRFLEELDSGHVFKVLDPRWEGKPSRRRPNRFLPGNEGHDDFHVLHFRNRYEPGARIRRRRLPRRLSGSLHASRTPELRSKTYAVLCPNSSDPIAGRWHPTAGPSEVCGRRSAGWRGPLQAEVLDVPRRRGEGILRPEDAGLYRPEMAGRHYRQGNRRDHPKREERHSHAGLRRQAEGRRDSGPGGVYPVAEQQQEITARWRV